MEWDDESESNRELPCLKRFTVRKVIREAENLQQNYIWKQINEIWKIEKKKQLVSELKV